MSAWERTVGQVARDFDLTETAVRVKHLGSQAGTARESGTPEAGNAYSGKVSPNDDAVAQVQAVLTRVGAQLDILRSFVAAMTGSDIPTQTMVGVGAHLDQLEAAAAVLAAHPTFTTSVLQNRETDVNRVATIPRTDARNDATNTWS